MLSSAALHPAFLFVFKELRVEKMSGMRKIMSLKRA